MLKRFHADNFRCLVNFEFEPSKTSLLVGRNGSGKTTVLQGLRLLRDFLVGSTTLQDNFAHTKTIWEKRTIQRFELVVATTSKDECTYVLEIDQTDPANPRLAREELSSKNLPLFLFERGKVQLFNDEHQAKGEPFEFSTNTSALTGFVAKGTRLEEFHRAATSILFFSLDPRQMEWTSTVEARALSVNGSNLPSWLRAVSLENPVAFNELTKSLKGVITSFEQLRFRDLGTAKALMVDFKSEQGAFWEATLYLSDGERCLLALYAILHAYTRADFTLVFDEPDNFIGLDEIRPWLYKVRDAVDDNGLQVLVASHHVDIVDYLSADQTFILSRPTGDITRLAPFEFNRAAGAVASEELRTRLSNGNDHGS